MRKKRLPLFAALVTGLLLLTAGAVYASTGLKDAHKNADSTTFKTDEAKCAEEAIRFELSGTQTLWHFVLNQVTAASQQR